MPKMFICMMTVAVAWEWPVSFGEKDKTGALHGGTSVSEGSTLTSPQAHGAWVTAMAEAHQDGAQFRGSESAGKKSWNLNLHDIRLDSAEPNRVEMRPSILDGLEMADDMKAKTGYRRSRLTSSSAYEGVNIAAEHDKAWAAKAYAYGGNTGGHWNHELAQHFFDQVMSKPPDQRESEYHSIVATTSLIEGDYHGEHGSENQEQKATQDARGTLSQGEQKIWPTLEYLTPISAQTRGMTPAERDAYWQKFKATGLGASDLKHVLYPGDTTGLRHDPDPNVHPLSHWTFLDNVEEARLPGNGKQCKLSTVAKEGSSIPDELWLNTSAPGPEHCLTAVYENRHSCSLEHFNYDPAAPFPRPAIEVGVVYQVVGNGTIELCSLPNATSPGRKGTQQDLPTIIGLGVWGGPFFDSAQKCTDAMGNVSSVATPLPITITGISNRYTIEVDIGGTTVTIEELTIPRERLRGSGESDDRNTTRLCGCVLKHSDCGLHGSDIEDCFKDLDAHSGIETNCGKYLTSGSSMSIYEIVAVDPTSLNSPGALCASTENYECTYQYGDRSCKHKICGESMIMKPQPLLRCATSTCNEESDRATCCEHRDVCSSFFCEALGSTLKDSTNVSQPTSETPSVMNKFYCAGTECGESDRGTCCNADEVPTDPFAIEVKTMISHFAPPIFSSRCKHLAPLSRVDDNVLWPGTGTCSKVFASHPRLVAGGYEIPDACGSNNEKLCSHVEQVRECGQHMNLTCSCLEYCAKLNLPNLSHPECPNDVCDVVVQTEKGWCHFYTTFGCSVDDEPYYSRVATNAELKDTRGNSQEQHVVPFTNVMWRMTRTCEIPSEYECPLHSTRKNSTEFTTYGSAVDAPEANLYQCCECEQARNGFSANWYFLQFDGCLNTAPSEHCNVTQHEIYDLNDPLNCVEKTCKRNTDTNDTASLPFDCTVPTDGWPGSMEYGGPAVDYTTAATSPLGDGQGALEYHTCCKCNATLDASQTHRLFYGPVPDGDYGKPNNKGCEPLIECEPEEWEFFAPTLRFNRVCNAITVCKWWEIELSPPTPTADRECGPDQFYVTTQDRACDTTTGAVPVTDGQNNSGIFECKKKCTAAPTCKAATLDTANFCALFSECLPKDRIIETGTKLFTKDFGYKWNDLNSYQSMINVGDLVIESRMRYSVKNNFPHNLVDSAVMDGRVITFKPCVYDFNPTGSATDTNNTAYDSSKQEACKSQMPIQTADITMPFYFDRVEAGSKITLSSLTANSAVGTSQDPYDKISADGVGSCTPATTWDIPLVATTTNSGNKGFVLFGTPYDVVYGSCGVAAAEGLIDGSTPAVVDISATQTLQRRTNILRVSTGQSDLNAEINVDLSGIILHRLSCASPSRDSAVGTAFVPGGTDSVTGMQNVTDAWDDGGAWYDVQGCGMCFDWCRWVVDLPGWSGGWPTGMALLPLGENDTSLTEPPPAQYTTTGNTNNKPYWSCRMAGTKITYTPKEWLDQFTGGWPVDPCVKNLCPISGDLAVSSGACMCDTSRGMGANDCRPGQYCYKTADAGADDGPTCNEVPAIEAPDTCANSTDPIVAKSADGTGNCKCNSLSIVEDCPVGATCSSNTCTFPKGFLPYCTASNYSLVEECLCLDHGVKAVHCGIGQVCNGIAKSLKCTGNLAACVVSPALDIAPDFIEKNCECGDTAVCGIGQHCKADASGGSNHVCTGGNATSGPGT